MIVIEWQGQVLQAKNIDRIPEAPTPNAKRGEIKGFSRRSRSRMIDLMARLDLNKVRVTFLTLTFHGSPTAPEAKKALKRLTMRIRRAFPLASGVWRMEFQERGAIHFHLLLFNFPFVPQRQMQAVWEECTGEDKSIVHITLVRNRRMLMGYVSKYIGKVEEHSSDASLINEPYQHSLSSVKTGRIWGWLNKECLPLAPKFELITDDEDLAGYLWFAVRSLSRGKSGKYQYCAKLYSKDAEDMYTFALQHGAKTVGEYLAHVRLTEAIAE